jgi:hypothetical protein
MIDKQEWTEFLTKIQNKLTNVIARETEVLMHRMAKSESDQICALASAGVFANGIALIKTSTMSEVDKAKTLELIYKYIDELLPDIVKQIEEWNKQGLYEKAKSGELVSTHKLEKDLDTH